MYARFKEYGLKRLRILQIFNRYLNYGGEEGSVYRIGDTLQRMHDVEYFLSTSAEILGANMGARLMTPIKATYNTEMAGRLTRFQKAGRFDVWQIHNVFPTMSPAVYVKAIKLGVPMVHYLHNYRLSCANGFFLNHGRLCRRCIDGNFLPALLTKCWHESHCQSGYMGLILAVVRQLNIFEQVKAWVAISHAQKAEHVRMGIPEERIHVVYHFLPSGGPPPPVPEKGHALFVGRLSEEKGVSHLLAAWRELRRPDRKLFIVGDGPEKERLQRYAAGHEMNNVVFTGFLNAEDQRELWRNAAFSVVPSIWLEPFGMTVLEAWKHGRPVIAHNLGALPELVKHGRNGLVVDHERPGELGAAMERLFAAPEEAQAMGRQGFLDLEGNFNQEIWMRKMQDVYQSLNL